MQLIRRLLVRTSTHSGRNRLLRGLSTAELVGIIIVVGILGALGTTYITGMVNTANNNTGNQNAVTLSTLANSYVTSGGSVASWNLPTAAPGDPTAAITALNSGVSAGGISYQMTPNINANSIANYTVVEDATSGMITFAHTPDTSP